MYMLICGCSCDRVLNICWGTKICVCVCLEKACTYVCICVNRENKACPPNRSITCAIKAYSVGHMSTAESQRWMNAIEEPQCRERRRWRTKSRSIWHSRAQSPVSPKTSWWVSHLLSTLCCRHSLWRDYIGGGKTTRLHHSFLLSIVLHSLSINVYSSGIHQGPLSKCYHKAPWRSLHAQLTLSPHLFCSSSLEALAIAFYSGTLGLQITQLVKEK